MIRLIATFGLVTAMSMSVTADETPDTFNWNDGAVNWFDQESWTPTATERTAPGIVGDTAKIEVGNATLDADATVSTLTLVSKSLLADPQAAAPVTLTLQSADGTTPAAFDFHSVVQLGNAPVDDNLLIRFASPVRLNGAKGGGATNRSVYRGRLTGGTADAPCPVTFMKNEASYNYAHNYLLNANNDFVGDITLEGISGQGNCTLDLVLGLGDVVGDNAMLGNAANEITVTFRRQQYDYAKVDGDPANVRIRMNGNSAESAGLCRKVHGACTIFGNTVKTNYSVGDGVLVLGDGFQSDPMLFQDGSQRSIYGTQCFSGSSIVIDEGAEFVVDVDLVSDELKSDQFVFRPKSAFAFTGALVVREQSELPTGTTIAIGTVDAAAGSCEAVPSRVTAGWELSAIAAEDGGWTLQLVKASSEPVVQCGGFSELGPDCATLTAKVLSMGSASSGELKVFYGPTDGGSDPDNWAAWKSFGSVSAPGVYAIALTGLSIQPYVYRAAIDAGGELTFAIDPATFTPVPTSTPGSFIWRRIEDNWDTEGAWERMTHDYARLVPGYAGDTICFDLGGRWNAEGIVYGSNAVVHIDHDVTVGGLTVSGGYNHNCDLLPADGVALVFDNNGKDSVISVGTASSTIGSLSSSGVLRMANALEITRPGTYGASVKILCPISGGTVDEPFGLTFSSTGDSYSAPTFALANAANDFVGDITVIRRSNAGNMTFSVGTGTILADDGMLGNVANKVHLRYSPTLSLVGSTTVTPVLSRHVDGTGTVSAKRYHDQWTSPKMGLALGATATLAPCGNDGTGFGTLTVDVTAFADTATTVYAIDVDADDPAAGDKVNLKVESAVELNGVFDVRPDDPSVRIPGGTRWAIGTIAASAGEVTKTRLAGNEMFKILVEGDAESGWTIYAERKQSGMSLIVR